MIRIGGRPSELAVRQTGSLTEPRLVVTATPSPTNLPDRQRVRAEVDRLLGTSVDLSAWYRMAAHDLRLRELAERFRGVKPPRFPTVFEALVNAFACQQLSLEVGLELLNRLAALSPVKTHSGRASPYGFPEPHDVARLSPARCRAIGFSGQKTRAILESARMISRRDLDPAAFEDEPNDAVREQLLVLRGVGRWTAEYVLLRGLGRLDVFPGDDVGAQKRLAVWLGRRAPLDYASVRRIVDRWQPFAGMVYFHLLLDGLVQRGALEAMRFEARPFRGGGPRG